MSIKQMLRTEAQIASSQPIVIPFSFENTRHIPEGKVVGESIVITPIKVRTFFALKPLLALIEGDDLAFILDAKEETESHAHAIEMMIKYADVVFEILTIGIHNKAGAMPQWFKETLLDNCTWGDTWVLLRAVLHRLGGASFTASITLLSSVSPIGRREIIALQNNLKTWN